MSIEGYWNLVEPVWEVINIYEGPEVFLRTYQEAPRNAALLFAAHFCQSEIRNGGFAQFFSNSTGVLAPEALDGFKAIGQIEVARTLEEAMQTLGPDYIRDRRTRQDLLRDLARDQENVLGTLNGGLYKAYNTRFFELIRTEADGFEDAADNFAAQSQS